MGTVLDSKAGAVAASADGGEQGPEKTAEAAMTHEEEAEANEDRLGAEASNFSRGSDVFNGQQLTQVRRRPKHRAARTRGRLGAKAAGSLAWLAWTQKQRWPLEDGNQEKVHIDTTRGTRARTLLVDLATRTPLDMKGYSPQEARWCQYPSWGSPWRVHLSWYFWTLVDGTN